MDDTAAESHLGASVHAVKRFFLVLRLAAALRSAMMACLSLFTDLKTHNKQR